LASDPNKVLSPKDIFYNTWGKDVIVGAGTIDVHIRKIRENSDVNCNITIKGVGCRIDDLEV